MNTWAAITAIVAGFVAIGLGAWWLHNPPLECKYNIALMLTGTINEPSKLTPDKVAIPLGGEFGKDIDKVVTVFMDGHVEFGPGFTADDAARAFWKKVSEIRP